MNNELMFSTGKDDWETPPDLFKKLDDEFHFTLDPCCTEQTAKCRKYYTKETDGLKQDWGGETVFVNPPYSAKEQDKWVKKCYEESQKPNTKVVALLPARTDTERFHKYILNHAEIRFIKGRIKFVGAKAPAPFPSMIVIW
jgi:phage N-6-adenine-methyltransferase